MNEIGKSRGINKKYCWIMCWFLITIMVMAIPFSGCGDQAAKEDNGKKEKSNDVYVVGDERGDWGYPTPFSAYPRGPGYTRVSFIFDTLIWKDEDGFVPSLAKDWEYHKDDLTYRFELYDGVKWHDGEEMTASDVVFTYEYLQKNPLGWVDISVVDSVEKLNKDEVEIKLEREMGAFLNNIAGVVEILPQHIWEDIEEPAEFKEPEAVIGTGPFKLRDYDMDQGSYRYEANENYHLGSPEYEELHFVKVSDPQMAIQREDVNFVQIEPEAKSTVQEQGLEVISGSHDWNLKLLLNHNEEPFDNPEFRRAIAYFIDTEMLVERALRGHGLPGSPGLISPDSRWYNEEIKEYDYDPQRGEKKLSELGYDYRDDYLIDDGGEVVELELYTSGDYTREGELVAEFLKDAGFEVELRSFEASVLDDRVKNWNYELAITGHGAVGGDPERSTRFMIGGSSPHLNARYEDPELKEKVEATSRLMDEEERLEKAHEIQELYAHALPAYTLYHPTWYYAHDGEVDWFFSKDGLAHGIPLPLNKLALIE